MNMQPVSSSNIASVGYDAEEQTLAVEFHSGSTYQYSNVPEAEFDRLLNAGSVGSYFNANIKNSYSATQV